MAARRVFSLLLAQLLTAACVGLRVEESAFASVYTVRAGDASNDRALRSLVSTAATQVYVRYAVHYDPLVLATIRVRDGSWSDEYGFSSSAPGELTVAGDVMVEDMEITVHKKQQLYNVTAANRGNVALEQDVLATENAGASIAVTTTGSGEVYLPPKLRLNVAALTLESHGYSDVRLVASDITTGTINVLARSSGAVKVDAQSVKVENAVSVRVAASGGASLSMVSLHAAQLNVTTMSSGDALFRVEDAWSSSVGYCGYQASGFGGIKAGSVACANANVLNAGMGDVTVRVNNALAYEMASFGSVHYAGARPHTISSTTSRPDHSVKAAVSAEVSSSIRSWADSYALPSHTPFKISDEERAADAAAQASAKAASHKSHKFPWHIAGLIALVIIVIARKNAKKKRNGRQANEKSRLLEDEPVYI